jgi:hypothetical protein
VSCTTSGCFGEINPFKCSPGAGAMSQVLEHLPSKHEALSSNPNTIKKEKKGEYSNVFWIFIDPETLQVAENAIFKLILISWVFT